ncbi:MAG: histidinol-phosphate transaminase [Pseudomonas sp.]
MNTDTNGFDPSRRRWLKGSGAGLAAVALPLPALAVPTAATPGPIRLDLNESSYGPSPRVAEAIARALPQLPRYVDAGQTEALQRQIAAIEGVAPEQVILGEVLEALGQHLAIEHGGGSFVYSVPGYGALVEAAAPFGGRAIEVPLGAQLCNDLPALSAAIATDTRALFVVNPHNPSGTLSERAAFDAFVRDAARRTLVIVDEAYLDYREDFAERTAARLLRAGANVVVFRTFGKLHALAGLQIGYALAPRLLADALRQRGVGGAHAQNQLSIAAAAASLADPTHAARVRVQVARERERWLALLRELGLRHAEPAASFVFFDAGRPQAELAAVLLERGIRIGRAFAPYTDWARISIGTPDENAAVQVALRTIVGAGRAMR